MPQLSGVIASSGGAIAGPVAEVMVLPPEDLIQLWQRDGQVVSPVAPELAMFDTGSSDTMLDPSLITELRLRQKEHKNLYSGTTGRSPSRVALYPVEIRLFTSAGEVQQRIVMAANVAIAHHGFRVVIGWDILQHCVLCCDGRNRTFTLDF